MRVITGDTRDTEFVRLLRANGIGRMVIGRGIRTYPGEPWGFDNGAYSDWLSGKDFDPCAFVRRYEAAQTLGTPYIAVLPDRVAQGDWSLEFSMGWLEKVQPFNWYLAVQDGMSESNVKAALSDERVVGLFLGGTDKFKGRSGLTYSTMAHEAKKRFHFGRAGTRRRIQYAREIGSDSLDSAFPLWNRARFSDFLSWVNEPMTDTIFTQHG